MQSQNVLSLQTEQDGAAQPSTTMPPSGCSAAVSRILTHLNAPGDFQPFHFREEIESVLRAEPRADAALLGAINTGNLNPDGVIRLIKVFELLCTKPKLLGYLLSVKSPDSRVRSKVTLTVGRLTNNLQWIAEQMADPDHRVRANVIEALWTVRREGIEELLAIAAHDSHHRVVANAACAYHKLGMIEAFEICRRLVGHSDQMARLAGLWAMKHIGDPRFLDLLHKTSSQDFDEREVAARREAVQYLENCLNLACFTDILSLHLRTVSVDPSGLRKVQVHCIPSDPALPLSSSELGAVNFTPEEDGRAVDFFEYRWIDEPEPLHFRIVAPDRLHFRDKLTQPHKSLKSKESISVARFQSLPSREVERTLPDVLERSAQALAGLAGNKHLFLILDRTYELLIPPAQVAKFLSDGIHVHALLNGSVSEELTRRLSSVSGDTGGTVVRSAAANELEKQLQLIRAKHAGYVELSWRSEAKMPKSLTVQCFGTFGYGELIM